MRRDQGSAQPDQHAHLVADGLGIAQHGPFLVRLDMPAHATDRTVEQADGVIGQPGTPMTAEREGRWLGSEQALIVTG